LIAIGDPIKGGADAIGFYCAGARSRRRV